ncbi:MAG TPA: hypothetical protein VGD84_25130 [Pseudonocardiaceae bacterium]
MSFLAVGTMAACTSATAGAPPITTLTSAGATSVSTSAPQPTTTAAPATSGAPTPGVLSRTYADNDGSVTLHVGGRLDVSLAGQWTFQPVSAPAVLHAGTPSVGAEPNCRPGMGCAIVTEEFTAAGAGTATIVATRTSCGEAMRCTSANDHFRLTVTVV